MVKSSEAGHPPLLAESSIKSQGSWSVHESYLTKLGFILYETEKLGPQRIMVKSSEVG